jgi:hypothetical protein
MHPLRIGVNALYMIPGGVGGTEIYLRALLAALDRLDTPHRFFVFINAETQDDLAPRSSRFEVIQTGVRAKNRPWRLAWEQLALPGQLRKAPHRCPVEPRIHRAGARALPDGHGVSRSPAQTPSGVFPLVRSAVLASVSIRVGAPQQPHHRGL